MVARALARSVVGYSGEYGRASAERRRDRYTRPVPPVKIARVRSPGRGDRSAWPRRNAVWSRSRRATTEDHRLAGLRRRFGSVRGRPRAGLAADRLAEALPAVDAQSSAASSWTLAAMPIDLEDRPGWDRGFSSAVRDGRMG